MRHWIKFGTVALALWGQGLGAYQLVAEDAQDKGGFLELKDLELGRPVGEEAIARYFARAEAAVGKGKVAPYGDIYNSYALLFGVSRGKYLSGYTVGTAAAAKWLADENPGHPGLKLVADCYGQGQGCVEPLGKPQSSQASGLVYGFKDGFGRKCTVRLDYAGPGSGLSKATVEWYGMDAVASDWAKAVRPFRALDSPAEATPSPEPTATDAQKAEWAKKYHIDVKPWKPESGGASSRASIPPVPTPRTTFTESSRRPELVYPSKGSLNGTDYETYRRRTYDAYVAEVNAYNAWLKTRPTPAPSKRVSTGSSCAELMAAWGSFKGALPSSCGGGNKDIRALYNVASDEWRWDAIQHRVSPNRGRNIKTLKGLGAEAKESPAYKRLMLTFEPPEAGGSSPGASPYGAADAIKNTNDYYERQRKHDEELHRQQMQRQHNNLNRALDKAIDRR